MVDQPYFLTLIDGWYSDRVSKALIPENQNNLYARYLIKFGVADNCRCHADPKEHLVAVYKEKFSTLLSHNYEKHLFTTNNPNIITLPTRNPELKSDLDSLLETGGKFNVFADLVDLATKDSFDELPNEELNRLFVRAYKNHLSFTKLYLRYCKKTINFLDLIDDARNPSVQSDPEYLDRLKIAHEVDKTLLYYINEISFADLN